MLLRTFKCVALLAIAYCCMGCGLWVEHFSVQENRLRVVGMHEEPIAGALVVRAVCYSALKSHGWGWRQPEAGVVPWTDVPQSSAWRLSYGFTDTDGGICIRPYSPLCFWMQDALLDTASSDGVFALIVYKPGYELRIVEPGVDVPAKATLAMREGHLRSYDNVNVWRDNFLEAYFAIFKEVDDSITLGTGRQPEAAGRMVDFESVGGSA